MYDTIYYDTDGSIVVRKRSNGLSPEVSGLTRHDLAENEKQLLKSNLENHCINNNAVVSRSIQNTVRIGMNLTNLPDPCHILVKTSKVGRTINEQNITGGSYTMSLPTGRHILLVYAPKTKPFQDEFETG